MAQDEKAAKVRLAKLRADSEKIAIEQERQLAENLENEKKAKEEAAKKAEIKL